MPGRWPQDQEGGSLLLIEQVQANRTTAAVTPTANAALVVRLETLAASSATPTPPTMLLIAAITLAR